MSWQIFCLVTSNNIQIDRNATFKLWRNQAGFNAPDQKSRFNKKAEIFFSRISTGAPNSAMQSSSRDFDSRSSSLGLQHAKMDWPDVKRNVSTKNSEEERGGGGRRRDRLTIVPSELSQFQSPDIRRSAFPNYRKLIDRRNSRRWIGVMFGRGSHS